MLGDIQMPPHDQFAIGTPFQLFFQKMRAERIGIVENHNIGLKFAESLFQQFAIGKGHRLRGNLCKAARADHLDSVHAIDGVALFVLKTENFLLDFRAERIYAIPRNLFDTADVRIKIVADL